MLNAKDLQTYTAQQVVSLVEDDWTAVRTEGHRRQDAAAKKIARLVKQMESARRELADGEVILIAAFAEMYRN